MEYKINLIPKSKYIPLRDYNYNCFTILESNISIHSIYLFLNSLIEYKLKNIWNTIVIHWIQMRKKMDKKNKEIYKNSIYSKQEYNHIHKNINDEELNDSLQEFIDNDQFKAVFVILCIQKDFHI